MTKSVIAVAVLSAMVSLQVQAETIEGIQGSVSLVKPRESLTVNGTIQSIGKGQIDVKDFTINSKQGSFWIYGELDVKTANDFTVNAESGNAIILPEDQDGAVKLNTNIGGTLTINSKAGFALKNEKNGIANIKAKNIVINAKYQGISNNSTNKITLTAENIQINTGHKYGVTAQPGAGIELIATNDISIIHTGTVENGGAIVNKHGDVLIKAQGNTIVKGDIVNYKNGTGMVDVTFNGAGSSFTGAVINLGVAETGGTSLTFRGGSQWKVTKNSELSALNMQDGVLAVDINLTDGAKDGTTQVNVNGAAQGTFDVALNITGAAAADFSKSEDWFLAQESGTLTVGKVTYQNGGVLAYDVKFFEEGAAPDAQGTSSSTGNKGQWHVVLGQSTPEAKQVLSLGASVSQGLGMLSESEDLRMRMGEVRNGVSDGLWTRTYARQDGAKGSFGKGFKQDTYGIYLGADRVVAIDDDSSWLLGGAFHYGRSDMEGVADANGGSSDLDQYSIKAYATYMQESGSFADIVLHAGYYDTDITGKTNNGFDAFSAKYHNWGYGISAEVGHRFTVGETSHGWFIEPTAQLTWFHSEGKDFKTSTKLSVSQSDADFVTGRLGALIGKTIAYGPTNNPMEKYVSFGVKGGLLYQFDGDQSIKMHGTENASVKVDAMDLNGARGYYGVNAEWAANKSWRIYGQVSREEGNGYTKDFDVSIGARYEFQYPTF